MSKSTVRVYEKRDYRGYCMSRLTSVLILMITMSVVPISATASPSQLCEILVTDFVHLGDSQPVWSTTVRIPNRKLRRSGYAAIEFLGVGVEKEVSSSIIVNGRKYALPVSEELGLADLASLGKSVIPIPIGLLRKGNNTIAIEAALTGHPTNLYDDFDLADIVLVLSR